MFDAFVTFRARRQPRAAAIITPDRRVSYAEFDADVSRLAAALRAAGVAPSSGAVSIQVGDPYLRAGLILALARLRVVSTPSHDSRADLVLCQDMGGDEPNVVHLTPDWLQATLSAEPEPVASPGVDPDAVGRILLSSGTTRTPKRVPLSWRMIEANVRNAAATYGAGKTGLWAPQTGIDAMMGFNCALTAWAVGATAVIGWPHTRTAEMVERLRPDLLAFTPIFLRSLLRDLPLRFVPQPDLRLLVGGDRLPPAVAREARLRLTPDVWVTYGAIECVLMTFGEAALLEGRPGAVGWPSPGLRLEVVDADGRPVAAGELGEVRVSGERVASRYLGEAPEAAAAFRHGGFYPGDLGRLSADGLLFIEGRADDRMNLGGHKLMPGVVDEVALACAGVRDAAAFAAPDEAGVDQCWLAVVQGEGFDRARLLEALRRDPDQIPPIRFAWIEAIPRNAMGKAQRRQLREETMALLGRERPA